MAQTRKRRKRKHRGTPAGTIEARGRTGRPADRPRGSKPAKQRATSPAERRAQRYAEPPTWRSSLNRSVIAAALFGVAVVLIFDRSVAQGATLAAMMVLLYWPMTYFLDSTLHRRHQRRMGLAPDAGRTKRAKDEG